MPFAHPSRPWAWLAPLALALTTAGCGDGVMATRSHFMSFVTVDGPVGAGEPIRIHLQGRRWQGPQRWALWSTDAQGRQSLLLAEGILEAGAPHVQRLSEAPSLADAPPRSSWALDGSVLPAPQSQATAFRLVVEDRSQDPPMEGVASVTQLGLAP